jgi:hypothetical protein
MPSKPTKFSTKLPSRGALNAIGKTKMTINDYAKFTPVKGTELEMSPLLQQLRTEQLNRR